MGLKPCGLGARDSLRTEAGLPLYGHEMSGELGLGVGEAGFGAYVKVYKPWFIGRKAFLNRQHDQKGRGGMETRHHSPVLFRKRFEPIRLLQPIWIAPGFGS